MKAGRPFDPKEALKVLGGIPGLQIQTNQPLRSLTSFRAGGPADLLIQPRDKEALITLIRRCGKEGWPLTVLGRASNILVADKGIRGITVFLSPALGRIAVRGTRLTCEAGAPLFQVAARAARLSLGGFEFACGIPGSIGGAVLMNAGAFDGSMADRVVRTEAVGMDGEIYEVRGEDHDFSYRHSCFSEKTGAVILETELELEPAPASRIYSLMADFARKRYDKQPLAFHSAGSAFRRPEGHFAGKLISDTGMKGYRLGQAGVSAKHAGFIVNHGGATAAEIARIFVDVRRTVLEREGVLLEPEVRPVGDWGSDPFAI